MSRGAARLCERPWSHTKKAPAPVGPGNHGAQVGLAPRWGGLPFGMDRWRRSRGSLADRLAIGGPSGPRPA
jgi:hypothetical protein